MVGGMVSEERLCCCPSRLVCGVPLVVYPVALLNGGGGGLCVVPVSRVVPVLFTVFSVFGLGPGILYCLAPLVLHSLVLCWSLPLCVAVLLCW